MTMIRDARRHSFFIVDNEIMRHYAPVLGPNVTMVYFCLIAHASRDDNACTLRMKTIAERSGISLSTVRRAVRTLSGEDDLLATAGLHPLISVTLRHDEDGARVSSRYTILPVAKDRDATLIEEGGQPDTPPFTESGGAVTENGGTAQGEQGDRSERAIHNKTFSNKTEENKNLPPDPPDGEGESATSSNTLIDRFERWYAVYPKKRGKEDARRAWKRIKPDDAMTDRMIQAVEQQKESRDWLKEGGKYIPYPATWLNRGSWEDEIEPELPGAPAGSLASATGKPGFRGMKFGFQPITYLSSTRRPVTADQLAAIESGAKLRDALDAEQFEMVQRAYADHCRNHQYGVGEY